MPEPSNSNTHLPERYLGLDGFRGVAAILVMLFHYTAFNDISWFSRAWIMVDAFFLLSGFVLQHAYAKRLRNGMSLRKFFTARLHRLYPLYFVGLLLGILAATLRVIEHPVADSLALLKGSVFGLLLVPWLSPEGLAVAPQHALHSVLPLNDPAWSLFFELFANLLFFFWVAKLRERWQIPLIVLALLTYLPLAAFNGSLNGGWAHHNFVLGFPRVTYHFFMGVLIYKLHTAYGPRLRAFAPVLTLAFLAISMTPIRGISAFATFILAPVMIMALSAVSLRGHAAAWCTALGGLSYPLYIVHVPIYCLLEYLMANTGWSLAVRLCIMVFTALIAAWTLMHADEAWRMRGRARLPQRAAV